jgi:hypothetical protein
MRSLYRVTALIMTVRGLVIGLALLAPLERILAQRALTFSIGGGASLPLGQFEDGANVGWHALASIGWSSLMQPIGLRLDAQHNRFTARAAGPDRAISSATLNLTYRLPMTNSPFSPYVIAGGGAYRAECVGGTDCGATTHVGWNAGLGTKFAAFRLKGFLESRWHAVNASTGNVRFVPVSLALTF